MNEQLKEKAQEGLKRAFDAALVARWGELTEAWEQSIIEFAKANPAKPLSDFKFELSVGASLCLRTPESVLTKARVAFAVRKVADATLEVPLAGAPQPS